MIDELEAYDEVCAFFYAGWTDADWMPIDGGLAPMIVWDGRDQEAPPQNLPFVRFTMQPTLGNQASLGGADGQKRWFNSGIISVQCFGPLEWNDGFEVAKYVAIMAKRIFQGSATPNGMWFRNCRTNRIGPSGGWFQFNTIIEYQFDEQR